MKTTIVTASQINEKTISMLVDAAYTDSFHTHLKSIGVSCGVPSAAIFQSKKSVIDEAGQKKIIGEEVLVNEISADGTLDDLSNWLASWQIPSTGM